MATKFIPIPPGDHSTSGNRSLTFANTTLSNFVESFTTQVERVSNVERVQCLYADQLLLDASFTQKAFTHSITVYIEEDSRREFADTYVGLANLMTSAANTLIITGSNSLFTTVDFGLCFLTNFNLENPEELLLHEAGVVKMDFIGTTVPTITQP